MTVSARARRRATPRQRPQVEVPNSTATAAIDQLAAATADRHHVDPATVARVAPDLLMAGARGQLNAVITMLEHDCKAFVDNELTDDERIGGHKAVGQMVARLKILRRMTEGT